MSLKAGRPHSDNPRQMRVEVKMTSDELDKLDFCCKYAGKSRSELMRDGIGLMHENLSKIRESSAAPTKK